MLTTFCFDANYLSQISILRTNNIGHPMKKVIVGTLLVLLTATAQSAVIEYSSSFSTFANANSGYYRGSGGDTWSASDASNVGLEGFDANLGTLTGVDISFSSSWDHQGYASAQDLSGTYTSYTSNTCGWGCTYGPTYYHGVNNETWVNTILASSLSVSLTNPAGATTLSESNNQSLNCSATLVNANNLTDHQVNCYKYAPVQTGSFNGTLDLSDINIQDFVLASGGFVDFRLNNNKTATIDHCDNNGPGDNCRARSYGLWGGEITIGYTYEEHAVPEPGALALLIAGLLLIGTCSRKDA